MAFGTGEIAGAEITKNELKITLIRGTARISEPKNKARYVPAGPPIETPELQCLGRHEMRFGCALNQDITSMQQFAESFYQPAVCISGDFSDLSEKQFLNFLCLRHFSVYETGFLLYNREKQKPLWLEERLCTA